MKIIIEKGNRERDGKVRLGKVKKEIRNTMMRFGYE